MTLQLVSGQRLDVKHDKTFTRVLEPKEEMCVLLTVKGPQIPGKYSAFYQLLLPGNRPISKPLQLAVSVERDFPTPKRAQADNLKVRFNTYNSL